MKILPRLLIVMILPLTGFGAVAANDLLLTQRNSDGTGNAQRAVTATANNILMFNSTLIPVSKTLAAGDNITITQNATTITINSTGGSGSGNVTTTGATDNAVMLGNGTTAIAPISSLGTSGWPLVSAGAGAPPAFTVLGLAGGGIGVATLTANAVITGNGTGGVTSVSPGTSGNILTSNGTAWTSAAAAAGGNVIANGSLTANAITSGNGTVGIGATTVTYNGTNSTLTVGTAGAGNIIANVVTLQNLTVTDLNATNLTLTNPVPVSAGGTNLTTITANNIITGNGTGNPILIAPGSNGNIIQSNGTAFNSVAFPSVSLTTGVTGTLPMTNGGTGFASTTKGNVIIGNNTTTYGQLGVGSNNKVLTANSSATLGVSWETQSGGGATAIARTAWVEVSGNDTTGTIGDITKPYATIDGAITALGTSNSTAKVVRIGTGRFAPMSGAVTGNASGNNYGATSIVYDNTKFYGSGKPKIKSDFTTLEDGSGTIIDGPFGVDNSGIEVHDLGIDSGSAVCTSRYSSSAVDGLDLYNQGQVASPGTKAPRTGCVVSNVVAICKSKTDAVHAMLFENLNGADISGVQTLYGTHGVVFKAINTTARGIVTDSHASNALIVKSNAYAPCYSVAINGVVMSSIATSGGQGFRADCADASAPDLYDISVSGVIAKDVTTTVQWVGGASATAKRIRVEAVEQDGVTNSYTTSGTLENYTLLINGVSLRTAPTLLNSWANVGGATPTEWWLENGALVISGTVNGGSTPSYVFNLPSAVRPTTVKRVPIVCLFSSTINIGDILVDGTGLYLESGVTTSLADLTSRFSLP